MCVCARSSVPTPPLSALIPANSVSPFARNPCLSPGLSPLGADTGAAPGRTFTASSACCSTVLSRLVAPYPSSCSVCEHTLSACATFSRSIWRLRAATSAKTVDVRRKTPPPLPPDLPCLLLGTRAEAGTSCHCCESLLNQRCSGSCCRPWRSCYRIPCQKSRATSYALNPKP